MENVTIIYLTLSMNRRIGTLAGMSITLRINSEKKNYINIKILTYLRLFMPERRMRP